LARISCHLIGRDFLASHWIISILKRREIVIITLRLAVDARTGGKPDIRPEWKRQRGRPCRTWVQQIEDDNGLNANDAWRIAHDRKSWRALRPVAGQAFH